MRASTRTAAIMIAGFAFHAAVGPAQADFFSDLAHVFQPPQPPQVYAPVAPMPGGAWRGRTRAVAGKKPLRARGGPVVAREAALGRGRSEVARLEAARSPTPVDKHLPHVASKAHAKDSSLADILRMSGARAAFRLDPTLRRGDVVVFEGGIRVFEGRYGDKHDAAEFRPIAASSVGNRSTLLELERVSFMRGREPKAVQPAAQLEDVPLTVAVSPGARKTEAPASEAGTDAPSVEANTDAGQDIKGSSEP